MCAMHYGRNEIDDARDAKKKARLAAN